MTDVLVRRHGVAVLECAADGPPLATDADATDLVGTALGAGVEMVAVPVARLAPEFFTLASGVAGILLQKLVTYRLRLAVVGDIGAHLATSRALRDLVAESNRGNQVWFVDSAADLDTRLAAERRRP
ncbi:MAG TPA: DUF4180 domain-containing protein [Micromonosporaceae bacterium]|nr:DUF4180 domain-containing protein [Micromonosporaceae bacterium]